MQRKIMANSSKIRNYTNIYFIITGLLFLIIPIEMMPEITERFQMLAIVFLCYLMFYYLIGIRLINSNSYNNYRLNNTKRMVDFQLNLFLFLGIIGLLLNLIAALSNHENITVYLLLTNILFGLINGVLKNKKYMYINTRR